ncbi:MAG: hypothetical protein DMG97_27565, partial [Acidobacteria bacterium]
MYAFWETPLSDSIGWKWAERLELARRCRGWRWAYYQRHLGRFPGQEEFERTTRWGMQEAAFAREAMAWPAKTPRKQAFKVRALYDLASAWLE